MDGRCRDTPSTPSFPQPTGTFFTNRSSCSSSAGFLDFCNTTASYAKAKYKAALILNWETCYLLYIKIIFCIFILYIYKLVQRAHIYSLIFLIIFKDSQKKPILSNFRFPFIKPIQIIRLLLNNY
ncbi:hypothetical protein BO94DRAFT_555033 [Aspergillus sclerotioniger CBS 115572]|uniref:Uncharacterized protein n=1 Tax=Aspergillus sclerotioniger CBS 115572 TaxID=1450535 RepID=A0A317WZP4_9EURO|nr:hypothetical protein BO94DRAFT_555033 [Aspergillus sclerotioniger CBS 115572]PWY91856.1 hypothetical protein BO94DRAFT_555033 [Aspergillus sclerotioniger CBS 115572]